MIFASPAWLAALVLVPGLIAAEAWLRRKDLDRLARLVSRPLWARVVRRPAERWRVVRLVLLLLCTAGLVLALARPQWGIVREKVEREGVDVVFVLDTSGSMATPDVAPSRFFLARQALLQLAARLEGDRLALVAFEGQAYPLVPLTLDADALSLFLETVEPGIVPAPGSSLGLGLAKGLDSFVDAERRNKAMVLVSDGENLEGDVDEAVRRAKQAGVVVHTVGVGTEAGQPVPELDGDGRITGYKRDEQGNAVVSRLNMEALETISRGTGGKTFRLTAADPSLSALGTAIEGMEQRSLAREYTYRRRERFQAPLAVALACLALALLLPLPLPMRRATPRAAGRAAGVLAAVLAVPAHAQDGPPPAGEPARPAGTVLDELLLRPRRATEAGRAEYARGNHPQAVEAFERAVRARPDDSVTRFNLADGLYKSGKQGEAAALFRALGADAGSSLAAASRYNLGNSLYQTQDYRGAIRSYREALRLAPGDEDARRNLELALRALKDQEEREKEQQGEQEQRERQAPGQDQRQPGAQGDQRPRSPQEKEEQRFRDETGMPKARAMQLLDALQQNEEAEQKRLLAEKRARKKKGKDW